MIFGSDGINYIRHPNGIYFHPRYQLPTVKNVVNVMVWGCFSCDGSGLIHQIEGIMSGN